jgi:Mg-chelatase subunit ChlD
MKGSFVWVLAGLLALLLAACAALGPAATEAEGEAPEAVVESPAEPAEPAAPVAEKEAPEDSDASEASEVKSAASEAEPPAEAAKTRDSAAESALGVLGELDFVADITEPIEVAEAFEGLGIPGGAAPPAAAPRSAAPRAAPASSGLKAGFADDNRQFNYYLGFLTEFGPQVEHLPLDVSERILLRVKDSGGKPLSNAALEISAGGRLLCKGTSYADGGFLFFPSLYGAETRYQVKATVDQVTRTLWVDRNGPREQTLAFPSSRAAADSVPLDLLFILDTTGSMGEEIERLKATIEIINLNLSALAARPRLRYGLVLYKDRGDEYVTRVVPLTADLDAFQAALNEVEADGGGDTPEDLQSALREAMALEWNTRGVRLSFVITDAPPHLDYPQEYTYLRAAEEARTRGIRLYTVGTGGLELTGEFILRQLSQQTGAKYIFLTYGETGESEGGRPGSVSHHTGANFQTDKLEAIIIRFAKEELAYLTDQPLEEAEDYFQAQKLEEERKEETLGTLFSMAVSQLIDYSSFRIPPATPASVLPISPARSELSLTAEYFSEQLILTCGADQAIRSAFRMVERADLQKLLEEMELQLSGLSEDADAARVGRLLGADLLIAGSLYEKQKGYELFLKLLRVETGEILSVTKALLDRGLGLDAD